MKFIIIELTNSDRDDLQAFDPNQFVFMKGRLCLYNLVVLFEKVTEVLNESQSIHSAYLDLAKT